MNKSIEFEFSEREIDNLFEIDTKLRKKTWFTFMKLQ